MDEEAVDHCATRSWAPASPASCFSPSAVVGVGRGVGETAGVGGAVVTKVIVCG